MHVPPASPLFQVLSGIGNAQPARGAADRHQAPAETRQAVQQKQDFGRFSGNPHQHANQDGTLPRGALLDILV